MNFYSIHSSEKTFKINVLGIKFVENSNYEILLRDFLGCDDQPFGRSIDQTIKL